MRSFITQAVTRVRISLCSLRQNTQTLWVSIHSLKNGSIMSTSYGCCRLELGELSVVTRRPDPQWARSKWWRLLYFMLFLSLPLCWTLVLAPGPRWCSGQGRWRLPSSGSEHTQGLSRAEGVRTRHGAVICGCWCLAALTWVSDTEMTLLFRVNSVGIPQMPVVSQSISSSSY